MTTITVLAGCPSAVTVTESLLAAGVPVGQVLTLGPDATATAEHAPMTSTVSRPIACDANEPDEAIRIRSELAMLVFTAGSAVDRIDAPAAIEVCAGVRSHTRWDPVVEAVLSGAPTLPVVTRLVVGGRTIREEECCLPVEGGSSDVATGIAAVVARFLEADLSVPDESPVPQRSDRSGSVYRPGPCLHWPEGWDEVDWSRPAEVLQRVVRAAALPGRSAWTWFGGARLGITAATGVESVAPGVPAGTVVGHAAGGVIVQTGSRALRIHGLRDLLGPVDAAEIPVGARLGHDVLTELATLTRRVHDLERLVLAIAGDMDLLGRPTTS